MKTKLPNSIKSIDEAKAFLLELIKNDEIYHPDDSAHDIITREDNFLFTFPEAEMLEKLMQDIFELCDVYLENFDPYEFIMDNKK